MSYIGNPPTQAAFQTDTFSGTGSQTAFTMSIAPAGTTSMLVAVTGVVQDPSTYSVVGTTLTFSAAPPTGTNNISVRYLGIPASGVTTTAYRTVTNFTATAGQTSFSVPSYTVGYLDVYRNGVRLAAADYTATTGTTVVLVNPASSGDSVVTEGFYVSSVLNAVPQYNGSSVNQTLTTPTMNTLTSGAGSSLQLQTNNGTTAVTVDTAQNVGVGVTPSAWNSAWKVLQIGAGANFVGRTGVVNQLQLIANAYFNGTNYVYQNTGEATQYFQTGGYHAWGIAPSGTAGNTATFTQAMTLDASGNLGVGTTSPISYSSKFIEVSNATSAGLKLTAGTSGLGLGADISYIASDKSLRFGTYETTGYLQFRTQDTERARIDSSGNLLVGTTSPLTSGTHSFVNVGTSTGAPMSARNSGASAGKYWTFGPDTSNNYRVFNNGGTGVYVVDGATSWTATSDERLKTELIPFENAAQKVCSLRSGIGRYLTDDETVRRSFLIAQDVQAVLPEAVTVQSDEIGTLGLAYTEVIPLLVAAIKEQQAIIEQLMADVAELKGTK